MLAGGTWLCGRVGQSILNAASEGETAHPMIGATGLPTSPKATWAAPSAELEGLGD